MLAYPHGRADSYWSLVMSCWSRGLSISLEQTWRWRQAVTAWTCAGKVGKLLSTLEFHACMATASYGGDLATHGAFVRTDYAVGRVRERLGTSTLLLCDEVVSRGDWERLLFWCLTCATWSWA